MRALAVLLLVAGCATTQPEPCVCPPPLFCADQDEAGRLDVPEGWRCFMRRGSTQRGPFVAGDQLPDLGGNAWLLTCGRLGRGAPRSCTVSVLPDGPRR